MLLSDPGMLLRKDKSIDRSAAAVIAQLLDAAGEPFGAALFAERNTGRDTGQVGVPVASAPGGARHRLAVNAQTVAFGYQKYFPAFEALQFALDDRGNMSGELLLDPSKTHANAFDSGRLLQSLPPQPALCAILPVSWQSAANLANKSEVTRQELGPWLLDQAQGPVGTCWYPESPLHSPVFSATLNAPSGLTDGALKSLTNWALRPSGSASLLRSDQLLVFSPDPKLADRVLAVNARRLASVADTTAMLAGQGPTVVVVTPRSLAQLIRDETSKSLAADTEPHLRAAAQRLFWPRLDALAKLPAFKISLASDALQGARGWRTLYWHNLEAR